MKREGMEGLTNPDKEYFEELMKKEGMEKLIYELDEGAITLNPEDQTFSINPGDKMRNSFNEFIMQAGESANSLTKEDTVRVLEKWGKWCAERGK